MNGRPRGRIKYEDTRPPPYPPPPPPECQLKTETQISIHSKRNRVEKRSKEKTIFAFPPAGNDWDLYPRHFLPRGAFLTRPPASTKATNYIERSQLTLHFPLLPILPLFRFESFIKRRPCFTAQSAVVHYLFIPSFIYWEMFHFSKPPPPLFLCRIWIVWPGAPLFRAPSRVMMLPICFYFFFTCAGIYSSGDDYSSRPRSSCSPSRWVITAAT